LKSSISILGLVVVVLFCVRIYCFDGFKSVQLLFAAAFVYDSCGVIAYISPITPDGTKIWRSFPIEFVDCKFIHRHSVKEMRPRQ
jgi:hypothetical protein